MKADRGSNATVISDEELERLALEAIQKGVILNPGVPVDVVRNLVLHEDQGYWLSEFSGILLRRFVERTIRAERRKLRPKPEQLLLFGLDHLPQRIVTPEGKRPLLAKATATEVRAYVKSLNRKHRDRIADLQSVLKIMAKYTPKNRRLTVMAVAEMEAEHE